MEDKDSSGELAMERSMLKNIIELNPYGIAVFDEDGRYVRSNQAYIDLFKLPPPRFLSLFDSPPLKKAGVQKEMFKLKEGNTIRVPQFWHNSRDVGEEWPDNPICISAVAFPLKDHKGTIRNYVIMFEDITEKFRIEEQLKEALRFKSDVMATISHELRTPLSGIIGSATLLLEDSALKLPERRMANLKNVLGNADKLVMMINNILNVARIDSGEAGIDAEHFSIGDVVNASIEPFQGLIDEKGLRVIKDVGDDLTELFNDKQKIASIVTNLVGNAVKFTDSGEVRIVAKLKEEDPSRISISVSDTGIGIPEDKLNRIFEHFERVDTSRTRRHSGIGLGLTIVKAYIGVLGGEIHVKSGVEKGTTVTVVLPVAADAG
jgi:signal transduction histidine kinase